MATVAVVGSESVAELELEIKMRAMFEMLERQVIIGELAGADPIFRNGFDFLTRPPPRLPTQMSNSYFNDIGKIEREDEAPEKGYMETVSFFDLKPAFLKDKSYDL
jgi:hypothetical protein